MRRYLLVWLTGMIGLLVAAPTFAQAGAGQASTGGVNWVALTSGFAMAIASAGCGIGQSKAAAAACEGLARNPGARSGIQLALILALIFIESLALYTLAMIIVKVV